MADKYKANPHNPKQPKRIKSKRFWKWLLRSMVVYGLMIAVFLFMLLLLMLAYYSKDLPDITEMANKDLKPSITIKSADGIVLAKYGDFKGNNLTFSQIPTTMIEAVIATEDRRFFDHPGVDIYGITRAQLVNFKAGKILQGGSTITQQLAKIIYLSPERTITRKIQEFIIALLLERRFSKEQIIAMYLNRVYLGKGNYGIDAAARFYFGKTAEELDLFESAIFAGMLKAPSRYAPNSHPSLAISRARYVLGRMQEEGFITKAQRSHAHPPHIMQRGVARGALSNPYYTDYVLSEVHDILENTNQDITVFATLDTHAQNVLEKSVASHMASAKEHYDASEVAAIIMEPSGAIKAMVGGKSYSQSQYNRAVSAKRQPGSAFKFFVYTAAMENGVQLSDIFEDKPLSIPQGGGLPLWHPQNYNHRFAGTMTVENAFAYSINTIAVQISEKVGRNKVVEIARRLGVTSELKNFPSIALGASETTLLEMTQALAHIPNNGLKTRAFSVIKILDQENNILYEQPGYNDETILSTDTVEKMKLLLSSTVEYGTAKAASVPFHTVYGKTGTSQEHRDAWFIGATPDIVGGIWVGNDNDSPMKNLTGGVLPARIWHDFIKNVGHIPTTELSNESTPWRSSKSIFDIIMGSHN